MNRDEPWKRPSRPDIELEPPTERGRLEDAERWRKSVEGDAAPIPEKPPHACPNCDYNLTGLTSRRCPECGEEFTLDDARLRANEIGEYGKAIRTIRRKEMLIVAFGIAAGIVGAVLLLACSPLGSWTNYSRYSLGFYRSFYYLFLLLVAAGIVKHKAEWSVPQFVLALGLLILVSGLIMLL